MKHAVIRTATGKVENIIILDPTATWTPPQGTRTQPVGPNTVQVGDLWRDDHFERATPTAEELAATAQAEADSATINQTIIEKGRQALQNWTTLTAAQKDAILKALLTQAVRAVS